MWHITICIGMGGCSTWGQRQAYNKTIRQNGIIFDFRFAEKCLRAHNQEVVLIVHLWRVGLWLILKFFLLYYIYKIFLIHPFIAYLFSTEDPLEKEMATHFSILAWRILWTEKSSGLWSIESQRVGHDWSYLSCTHDYQVLKPNFLQGQFYIF